MPKSSTTATPTKTRKTRTRKTSTTRTAKTVATPKKVTATVRKVKSVAKVTTPKPVTRPASTRLITPSRYMQDIKQRWAIHNYEIKTAGFISHINVCVFSETTVNSVGQHSNNNSRTTLQFTKDRFLDCVEACVWGTIKQNRVNVGFVKVAV